MAVAVLGCQDPRCYSSLMARSAGDDSPRSMAEQLAEVLWGPEPSGTRGPRPVLTRATVVEAAIVIADSEGLSATSLRAIAGRLGVSVAGLRSEERRVGKAGRSGWVRTRRGAGRR